MVDKDEVEKFLNALHQKIRSFGIALRPRVGHIQGLAELGIMPIQREEYILNLKSEDYSTGPNKDTYDQAMPDYFEFGIPYRNKEIYIKLSLGLPNKQVDCMSFHVAKHKMDFPLKP